MSKPIGILGGTFDPVHIGHLRMALELLAALELSEVRFIPVHTHPFGKTPVATPEQRAEMLRLALADLPQCKVDTRELQRANVSYTVETLASLHAEVEETPLCLFLGLDAFRQLDGWHRWQELLDYCHLVVVDRPDMSPSTADLQTASTSPTIQTLLSQHAVDSPGALHEQRAGCVLFQSIPTLDISATQLRNSLKHEQTIRFLVPDAVLDYIHQHQLYTRNA
ncbi:nicotinate-nucleotide adenylyltransferase [Methylohalomonas lacus]|uniref:Probable nicotinate-nucleotide adenylyltransferase n=1 Tax=Methylohalomonas lacus TaxID=398773 RepID=A0AAE3HKD5_9GAMM|nr:nicotinate-nucleotide adenylyltransferase [Methylohalomonas lacus]MCS3903960.1 nicotinate-nucleotide adenylyltransferase [Methylohalomonas lacus]